jgi:NarL family two-component system sensor histidine kinase YdfH
VPNTPEQADRIAAVAELREMRPFYWILLVVVAFVYGWTVWQSAEMRSPLRLAAFTALMLLYAGLHWWVSPVLSRRPQWFGTYLVVQGAIVFGITLLAGKQLVTIGLYLALVGQAAGSFDDVRRSVTAVGGLLVLMAVNVGIQMGWAAVPSWLLMVAPMTLFVVVYVALFMRQAKARERAQALLRELETAHRQLGEYAGRVEDLTLAAERQRMARELHDTLAQGLAGLILQLEAMDASLGRGQTERAQGIAQDAMARARATLADARHAIDNLRLDTSAPADLCEAVRQESERFTAATGIPCELDLRPPEALPAVVQEHALRAVTEALNNVARHARASHVSIQAVEAAGGLTVVVRDNGAGFDPLANIGRSGHYGLLGLRERARLGQGSLEVVSAPGRGTAVTLRLPQGAPVEAGHG